MLTHAPYRISAEKIHLVVMNATEGLPSAFALLGTRAAKKVAIRLLGGCKGMGPADKEEMLDFFSFAFNGFRGLIWSGGTRQVTENGEIDPMVTDMPGVIAQANPGCIALGTIPRVDMLSLQGDSRLVLDQYGNVPNPDMMGLLIVQNGADGQGDWDTDVPVYVNMMKQWKAYAGFTALGTVAWNGGAITEKEIFLSAQQGWMTVLIEGSGRVADEIAEKYQAGDSELLAKLPRDHRMVVVSKNDPEELTDVLQTHGFFPA